MTDGQERLYGQGTRWGMAAMFAAWTLIGAIGAVYFMPENWGFGSRLAFGATLGFFSAMFPYTNRLLAIAD